VHPKKTEGPDIPRRRLDGSTRGARARQHTQLTSLELCIDSNELDWRLRSGLQLRVCEHAVVAESDTPLPMENQPRAVFERLFGDSDDTTTARRGSRASRGRRSVLDSLLGEVSRLKRDARAATIAASCPVPRCDPRHRAAHPESRTAERHRAAARRAADGRHPGDLQANTRA
jgi:hypothetical protein